MAAVMKRRLVGVDANGNRVGEDHPKARLSDHDIDLIRQLHDEGLGYRTLARKFECDKSTIRDVVKCRRRFATATRWKSVGMAPVKKG